MQQKAHIFERIFKKEFPRVKAFAMKILKSETDAEDIAQDVFLTLWKNPAIWENGDLSAGFLFVMTKNKVFNFLRHKNIEYSHFFNGNIQDILADTGDSVSNEIYAREIRMLITLAVDNMPEQRRKVFTMSRLSGMTYIEIAEKLGLSVRTVERHAYLALKEIRTMLEEN